MIAHRVCMTCGLHLGDAVWPGDGPPVTTHGLCWLDYYLATRAIVVRKRRTDKESLTVGGKGEGVGK